MADRNFDDIACHFEKKVYGGLKGQIRLAVLSKDLGLLQGVFGGRPLRILDIGAGLGQISLKLAQKGHHCTLTDISSAMLDKALQSASTLAGDVVFPRFIVTDYQSLDEHITGETFDVILCYAVLEWVANPKELFDTIESYLATDGVLSLCFYNPASLVYRNLMMGNFHHLKSPKPSNKKSLTPNNPVSYDMVKSWLTNYHIIQESGIRVFSDYTSHKRGGLANADDVIAMELAYSDRLPFRLMGRYLHIMAQKSLGTSLYCKA